MRRLVSLIVPVVLFLPLALVGFAVTARDLWAVSATRRLLRKIGP